MEGNFTGKHINAKVMTEKEVWTKIRHQVRKKYDIEHYEIQQWQLTDALVAEIVKLSSIPDVVKSFYCLSDPKEGGLKRCEKQCKGCEMSKNNKQ